MATNHGDGAKKLRFIDPSVDPSILWDISKFLAEVGLGHLTIRVVEILWRFPAVEHAVGFDGVDDWIRIDDLDIRSNGIDVETSVWISQDNQGCELLDFTTNSNNSILTLADTTDEESEIQIIYENNVGRKKVVLSRIEPETWQDLRIWSDGNVFSIEVNGNQVSLLPDIDLEDGPFKFYFGRGCRRLRYFRGMVKHLQIHSGANQLFNLQGGDNPKIDDETDSAVVAGTHSMKKGRFQKEFST